MGHYSIIRSQIHLNSHLSTLLLLPDCSVSNELATHLKNLCIPSHPSQQIIFQGKRETVISREMSSTLNSLFFMPWLCGIRSIIENMKTLSLPITTLFIRSKMCCCTCLYNSTPTQKVAQKQ